MKIRFILVIFVLAVMFFYPAFTSIIKAQTVSECNFVYSDWTPCLTTYGINHTMSKTKTQTRTVISSSPDGCSTAPVLSQACTSWITPANVVCTSYTYSDWSECTSMHQQYRTVTMATPLGCNQGLTPKPVLSQSCGDLTNCTPSWLCSPWSACSGWDKSGPQTRYCNDLSYCATTAGMPNLGRPCCIPKWSCTDWSSCIILSGQHPVAQFYYDDKGSASNPYGQKTRTCTDINNCGGTEGKPIEAATCVGVCNTDSDCAPTVQGTDNITQFYCNSAPAGTSSCVKDLITQTCVSTSGLSCKKTVTAVLKSPTLPQSASSVSVSTDSSASTSGDASSSDSLISITVPAADSVWSVGKSNYIKWIVDESISKVNITLINTDSGDETTLRSNVSASRGYYLWNISKKLAPGNYTVTVTDAADDTNTATSEPFTLTVKVSGIKITSPSSKVSLSSTLQLDATVSPDNASDPTVTWSVKNGTGKATIDDTGLLTPAKIGTVTVTATSNDGSKVKSTKTITITKATATTATPVRTTPVTTNPITTVTATTTSSIISATSVIDPVVQAKARNDLTACIAVCKAHACPNGGTAGYLGTTPKCVQSLAGGATSYSTMVGNWSDCIQDCAKTYASSISAGTTQIVGPACTQFTYGVWSTCLAGVSGQSGSSDETQNVEFKNITANLRTVSSMYPAGCTIYSSGPFPYTIQPCTLAQNNSPAVVQSKPGVDTCSSTCRAKGYSSGLTTVTGACKCDGPLSKPITNLPSPSTASSTVISCVSSDGINIPTTVYNQNNSCMEECTGPDDRNPKPGYVGCELGCYQSLRNSELMYSKNPPTCSGSTTTTGITATSGNASTSTGSSSASTSSASSGASNSGQPAGPTEAWIWSGAFNCVFSDPLRQPAPGSPDARLFVDPNISCNNVCKSDGFGSGSCQSCNGNSNCISLAHQEFPNDSSYANANSILCHCTNSSAGTSSSSGSGSSSSGTGSGASSSGTGETSSNTSTTVSSTTSSESSTTSSGNNCHLCSTGFSANGCPDPCPAECAQGQYKWKIDVPACMTECHIAFSCY